MDDLVAMFFGVLMRNQKKDKVSVAEHDESFDDACKNLIEALVEEDKTRLTEQVDPFENYVERVRSKMHLDNDLFRSRFVKGYQVLIEELKHE